MRAAMTIPSFQIDAFSSDATFLKSQAFRGWNPSALGFCLTIQDWRGLTELARDVILRLTALFQASEEAVTLGLLDHKTLIERKGG